MKTKRDTKNDQPLQFRQGDILLTQIDTVPNGLKLQRIRRKCGALILAEGELTGHTHRILEAHAELFQVVDGRRFLSVRKATPLLHEEHAAVDLEPGIYRVMRQRKYRGEDQEDAADD